MMGSGTSFHPNEAGCKFSEKRKDGYTPELFLKNDGSLFVNTMDLKDIFGDVDSNNRNVHD